MHRWQCMGIYLEGNRHVPMSQPFSNDMDRRTSFQEQRGTSVTKTVECYSSYAGLPDHRIEFHLPEGVHGLWSRTLPDRRRRTAYRYRTGCSPPRIEPYGRECSPVPLPPQLSALRRFTPALGDTSYRHSLVEPHQSMPIAP